jgi:hypothetical protein
MKAVENWGVIELVVQKKAPQSGFKAAQARKHKVAGGET